MKSSSRYLLIALGIAVFFILAPLLILYVSGTRVTLNGDNATSTGILDAKSEPNGAKVFVEGEEKGTAPTTVRFLNQGEYEVKLTKDGYYDWSKRLPIEAGQVTYAQEGVDQVQLIKNTFPKKIVDGGGVKSFTLINDAIWYVNGFSIIKTNLDGEQDPTAITLPFSPDSLIVLRDKRHVLARAGAAVSVIDTATSKVVPLPSGTDITDDIVVVSEDKIIFRQGYQIKLHDSVQKTTQTLRTDCTAFTMLGTTAYFIDNNRTAQGGITINAAVWNGMSFIEPQPILGNVNVKDFLFNKLIITDSKELFVENDNLLYRVGEDELELLTSSLVHSKLDLSTNELTFSTGSELWFYNFKTNKPQLLTRGTVYPNDMMIRSSIGYGFIASSKGLELVEIDTRDKQNRYQILKDVPVYQIAITENQKTVVALQNGSLVSYEIRD